MFSAQQVLAALKNNGVGVALTKHPVIGYSLTFSGNLTSALSKLATTHREELVGHLAGKQGCPCGGLATIRVWRRRVDKSGDVPTIVVEQHYFCATTFKDLATNFIGWKLEPLDGGPAVVKR